MQWTSAFSAISNGDALFPNDFGEDLFCRALFRDNTNFTVYVPECEIIHLYNHAQFLADRTIGGGRGAVV